MSVLRTTVSGLACLVMGLCGTSAAYVVEPPWPAIGVADPIVRSIGLYDNDDPWPTDYRTMQDAAGVQATSWHPDFKLQKVVLIVEYRRTTPKILRGHFWYVRPDVLAPGQRVTLAVNILQRRRQQQVSASEVSHLSMLPLATVPEQAKGPDELLHRLAELRTKARRGDQTMRIHFDRVATLLPRNDHGHPSAAESSRFHDPGPEEFIKKIAPAEKWIWWTEVELAKPGAVPLITKLRRNAICARDPVRRGACKHVANFPDAGDSAEEWSQFIIMDAVLGETTIECAEPKPSGNLWYFVPIKCK